MDPLVSTAVYDIVVYRASLLHVWYCEWVKRSIIVQPPGPVQRVNLNSELSHSHLRNVQPFAFVPLLVGNFWVKTEQLLMYFWPDS